MIELRYRINGARFRRRYDDTPRQRMAVWARCRSLLENGVPVRIKMN